MEVGGERLGSDVEGQDLVDVDDLSRSGTESELSVAWSSHHQEEIADQDAATKTTGRINKPCVQQRTKSLAKKKTPTTTKKKREARKKQTSSNSTTTTTTATTANGLLETETAGDSGSSSCGLEASVEQVAERFAQGCECRDGDSCFANINPESAYRHRLNIAELTRSEHDMYLMGVTMASLSNPEETARRTERKRLHTQYVFQGKKICLEAFLYLENCTQYQLKRIRKHIMTQGVTPRVHGNHGKRPHNRFSLDIYQQATAFLQSYIQRAQNQQLSPSSSGWSHNKSKNKAATAGAEVVLPADETCKTVHSAYKEYMEHFEPGTKWLGYSTFRHFMKRQFPLVKFTNSGPAGTVEHQNSPTNRMASSAAPKNVIRPPPVVTTGRVEGTAVGQVKAAPAQQQQQQLEPCRSWPHSDR